MEYKNCIVLLMGFAGSGKFTIAKEIAKHPHFKLVDNHLWNNVIFRLIEQDGITPLPEAVWDKSGKVCNAVFETMKELSPNHFSFVITNEMIEGDKYPPMFFQKVVQLANERNSLLLPVRLICEEKELVRRVKTPERLNSYKTIDDNRAKQLSRNNKVFHSHHVNEITIDVTNLQPSEACKEILNNLDMKIFKMK